MGPKTGPKLAVYLLLSILLLGCNVVSPPTPTPSPTSPPTLTPTLTATASPTPTPTFTPSPTPRPTATFTPRPTATLSLTAACPAADDHFAIRVQFPCRWEDLADAYIPASQDENYRYAGIVFLVNSPDLHAFEQGTEPGIIIGASKDAAKWYGHQQLLTMTLSWLPDVYDHYTIYDGEVAKYQDSRFRGSYKWHYFKEPGQTSPKGKIWIYVLRPDTPDLVPDYVIGIVMVQSNDIPDATWESIMDTVLKTLTINPDNLP